MRDDEVNTRRTRRGTVHTLRVEGMPEVIAGIRQELAVLLRDEADTESHPHTAQRLREIAAVFETGQREDLPD